MQAIDATVLLQRIRSFVFGTNGVWGGRLHHYPVQPAEMAAFGWVARPTESVGWQSHKMLTSWAFNFQQTRPQIEATAFSSCVGGIQANGWATVAGVMIAVSVRQVERVQSTRGYGRLTAGIATTIHGSVSLLSESKRCTGAARPGVFKWTSRCGNSR